MKRINVRLKEGQYQRVKDLAERERKNISQIIRELIDESFQLKGEERKEDSTFEVIGNVPRERRTDIQRSRRGVL